MKKQIYFLMIILFFIGQLVYSQSFTRITDGDIVTDGGDSRGCSWGDYDNDGDIDLFVTNRNQANCLYRNNGDGSFTKITSGVVVSDDAYSQSGSWGDYDNDGDLDLFVANGASSNNFLYRNEGNGVFSQITNGDIVNDGRDSYIGVWADFDNDGDLDIFVCNYNDQNNLLYMNDGNGTFTQITTGDIVNDGGYSFTSSFADYDNDGDLDIFVANAHYQNNFLYQNNGNGTFEKITTGDIVTDGGWSNSSCWGDYDNDGDLDLFVTNGENNLLYSNNGDGSFTKITEGKVVTDGSSSRCASWGDLDNDGDLDLFLITGENNLLYSNNGDGTFTQITTGDIVNDTGNFISGCWGDYDKDGDLDLFIANMSNENNLFYNNDGNNNNWINIKCVSSDSNATAIGTKVRTKATIYEQPTWQMRMITEYSHRSHNSFNIEFGFGDASVIDSLVIIWPSGFTQVLTDVDVNQFLIVKQPSSMFQVEIPKLNAFSGDSILVPVNVKFPIDSSYSSCELNIGGYMGELELIEIVTDSSLIEYKEWTYQLNETEDEAIIWMAGSEDISGEGVLIWLHYSIPEESAGFIPITMNSAVFNTEETAASLISGGIQIFPTLFGDVDLNDKVQAFDASLILKHLVDSVALDTFQLANADVSTDSTVSAFDATLILQYGVGLIDSLPHDTSNGLPKATGMIVMQDQDISMGEIVNIPLSLSEANNILSFEGMIKYSSNHFIYNDIVWSEAFDNFVIEINNKDGEIKFAGASTTSLGQIQDFANLQLTIREDYESDTTDVIFQKLRWNEENIMEDVARSKLSIVTGINKHEMNIPKKYTLNQNFPNPFNPTTTIGFGLPKSEFVVLKVYNILGQEAATLISENLSAGVYNFRWDASHLPSGIYYYQLTAGSFLQTKKLTLIK